MLPERLVSLGERAPSEITEATAATTARMSRAVATVGASVRGNSEVQAVVNRGEGVSSSSFGSRPMGRMNPEEIAAATARASHMMPETDTDESWSEAVRNCPSKPFRDAISTYSTAEQLLMNKDDSGKITFYAPHWIYDGIRQFLWDSDDVTVIGRENKKVIQAFKKALKQEVGPKLANCVFPNSHVEEMLRERPNISSDWVRQVFKQLEIARYKNPIFYARHMALTAQVAAKQARIAAEAAEEVIFFSLNRRREDQTVIDYAKMLSQFVQWIHIDNALESADEALNALVAENRMTNIRQEHSTACIDIAADYVVAVRTAAMFRCFSFEEEEDLLSEARILEEATTAAVKVIASIALVNPNDLTIADDVSTDALFNAVSLATKNVSLARDYLNQKVALEGEEALRAARVALARAHAEGRIDYLSSIGKSVRYDDILDIATATNVAANNAKNAANEINLTIETLQENYRCYQNNEIITAKKAVERAKQFACATAKVANEAGIDAEAVAQEARAVESARIEATPYEVHEKFTAVTVLRADVLRAVAKASADAARTALEALRRADRKRVETENMARRDRWNSYLNVMYHNNHDYITRWAAAISLNIPAIPVVVAHVMPMVIADTVAEGPLPPSGNQQENQSRNSNTVAIPVAVACATPAIIPEPIVVEALPQNANQQENHSRNRN